MHCRYGKKIVSMAHQFNVPCIIATQFLEELAQNDRICSPEMNDIFCTIHQKMDSIMLAGEGAASKNSSKCIEILRDLIGYESGKGGIIMSTVTKKTKIMATAGPTLQRIEDFEKAIKMNVNEYRIHMGLRNRDFYSYFKNIRVAGEKTGRKVEVLLDLPSTRPRIEQIKERMIEPGESVKICDSKVFKEDLNVDILLSNFEAIRIYLKEGERIVFRDGQVVLEIVRIENEIVEAKCIVTNALLKKNCSSNFPDSCIDYNVMDDVDLCALKKIKKMNLKPDWIAMSFASSQEQVEEIKNVLQKIWGNEDIRIMAKIENRKGLENIDEIIECVDGIMVARGDLIVNINPIFLPRIQLELVNKCNYSGKKVVVATQFFERFALTGIINRSELSDVALAFREGSDSIMLAMESGNSKYNFECIKYINDIIECEYQAIKEESL